RAGQHGRLRRRREGGTPRHGPRVVARRAVRRRAAVIGVGVSDPIVAATIERIRPVDAAAAAEMQAALDRKTKPQRSLGRLEELSCRIAAIRGTAEPVALSKAVVLA